MASPTSPILYSNDDYLIRPAHSFSEFKPLWWKFMQELGWDRGYYDLETYISPSAGHGMLLLIEKSSSKPVGHIAAVINANSTGWIAMFIIDEPHRGKGMGSELFKAAMRDFERNGTRIMGLDGVPQQKETYKRRGFVESKLGELRIMTRPLVGKKPLPPLLSGKEHGGRLVDLREVPYELLVEHELEVIGFERPKLWNDENLFSRPDVHGLALVSSPSSPQKLSDISAWALIRRCSNGFRIGPVYASDELSAEVVLSAVTSLATVELIRAVPMPDEPMNAWSDERIKAEATVVAEVWTGNKEAEELFEKVGWEQVNGDGFGTAHRMWVGGKATGEHSTGGKAQKQVWAVFDAAVG